MRSTSQTTRRGLLAGAAAGAAATAIRPAAAPAATSARSRRADVVVVGAGLAGLVAARRIVAAGRSVLVVEARDRVGGRLLNQSLGGGQVVEVGGQWVGPTQDRVLALARDLGLRTFPTYNSGDNVMLFGGARTTYPATAALPPLPADVASDGVAALAALDAAAATVPRDAPWTAPRAREWDAQTLETWKLANLTTPGGRALIDLISDAVWAAEPADVSLLHVLFYIAAAGNAATPGSIFRLTSTAGGAQEQRIVGGSQRLALELAERLGRRRLILGAPVRRIVQSGGGVRVDAGGVTVRARRAIVTLAPTLAGRIDYEPQLPALRDQLTQRVPQGSSIKCLAVYDRPFWRDQGLSGQAIADTGPVKLTFDNTPPSGRPGVLLGFLEGRAARELGARSASARRAAVLARFGELFGDAATRPRRYIERNWAEERFTRGCYVGFTPPGVLTDYGTALREPVGRIHWAGAETATIWNGYMDGAVSSGERAAREVL